MKIFFLTIVLSLCSFSGSALPESELIKRAVESLSSCGNFIRADQSFVYTGFGFYHTGSNIQRQARPASVRLVDIQTLQEYQVVTEDSAVDVLTHNSSTYILTYSGIEEWDMSTRQRKAVYPTKNNDQQLADEQHPKGMALYKNKLIIAHGRLGVSFFNLSTKTASKILPLIFQGDLESVAQDVTVSGRYGYVVMDSYTLVNPQQKPPFRGIAVVDMENETVTKLLGDLPPGLSSVNADQKSLVASFYGNPIWKFSIDSILASNSTPPPTKRIFKFPKAGYPTGKAFMDEKYYYSCFWNVPAHSGFFKRGQIVMNRAQMILD